MKDLKKIVAVFVAAFSFFVLLAASFGGCYRLGPEETESATVVGSTYLPSTSGTGFSTSGKLVFTSTEARYAVTLRCQHGNFVVEGSDGDPAQWLWKNFIVGDQVRVRYQAKYGHSDDGVRGYRFLSAEKVR